MIKLLICSQYNMNLSRLSLRFWTLLLQPTPATSSTAASRSWWKAHSDLSYCNFHKYKLWGHPHQAETHGGKWRWRSLPCQFAQTKAGKISGTEKHSSSRLLPHIHPHIWIQRKSLTRGNESADASSLGWAQCQLCLHKERKVAANTQWAVNPPLNHGSKLFNRLLRWLYIILIIFASVSCCRTWRICAAHNSFSQASVTMTLRRTGDF